PACPACGATVDRDPMARRPAPPPSAPPPVPPHLRRESPRERTPGPAREPMREPMREPIRESPRGRPPYEPPRATPGASEWRAVAVVEGTPAPTAAGIDAFQAGDYARDERELREAAQAYPRSGVALVYLARIERTRGDETRAEASLEEALRRDPELASAHREL